MQYEHENSWTKKSWLNDLSNDRKLARDLNSIYADDVIEAVENKDFGNLDDAIAELTTRVGLTTSDVSEVKRMVVAKTDPNLFVAQQNIMKLSKKNLAELLKVATGPNADKEMSSVVSKAVETIGLDVIAEMHDSMEDEKHEEECEKEETAEAKVASAIKSAGSMPQGLKDYLDKKNGKKPEDEETSKKDDEKKDDEKDASVNSGNQINKWAEFLDKKGYFQGADEKSHEGNITSNNPESLGYKSKEGVGYDRKPMAVPVGEDARPWEDKSFDAAAKESAKNFLPGGKDLELKKIWQRARYKNFVKKMNAAKK